MRRLAMFPSCHRTIQLAAQLKGFSSWATSRELWQEANFRWQAGYGAFTVATRDLPSVASHVFDQKRRHRLGETDPRLENTGQPPQEA